MGEARRRKLAGYIPPKRENTEKSKPVVMGRRNVVMTLIAAMSMANHAPYYRKRRK